MNILFLTTHLNQGGITSYILSLACGLKKRANNVFIASSGGEMQGYFESRGIRFIHIPIRTKCELSPKILISFFKLKKEIERQRIDIIHAHTRVTQVLGTLLSKFSSSSYLSTCHGFFKKRFSRMIFPAWGEKIIAISEAVAKHLQHDFKVNFGRIAIIHNGIDCEKFLSLDAECKNRIKRKFKLPKDNQVIGMVARLSEVKGHTFFIQAMPLILKEIPKSSFLIVGEGRLKHKLQQEVKRLNLESCVFFIPTQSDTREVLGIMDCFVSCSIQEGLGLSIMEAQAQGVPVVAFATGGIPSLIQDGQSGLLVKREDVKALAQGVIRLLADERLRQSITEAARENLKHRFSIDRMVEETLELYKGLGKNRINLKEHSKGALSQ